ncbi:hypothetical protein LZG72_04800 [Dyadobacter sp. CY323]|nr:hypothetical protein [Dyadobacter sp. CY323]
MAAVAYNLKKLVNGISIRTRKRISKTLQEVKTAINRLLPAFELALSPMMVNLFEHPEKQMAE